MQEYHEMQQEAVSARAGADRMAMGLPCIPDPIRGDMAEIERLRAVLDLARVVLKNRDRGETEERIYQQICAHLRI